MDERKEGRDCIQGEGQKGGREGNIKNKYCIFWELTVRITYSNSISLFRTNIYIIITICCM